MSQFVELTGSSGRVYRYKLGAEPISIHSGNFVLLDWAPDETWKVVYAGEAETLATAADHLVKAQGARGLLQLYVRFNISAAVRCAERDDIIAAYEPPRNLGRKPRGSVT